MMDCEWAKPHPKVVKQFDAWVLWDDGCDEQGNFIGHCPLHDASRAVEGSAEFNFVKGVMRCSADCHPGKRAMSITNVARAMSNANGG
jgi:hypothetical protein